MARTPSGATVTGTAVAPADPVRTPPAARSTAVAGNRGWTAGVGSGREHGDGAPAV